MGMLAFTLCFENVSVAGLAAFMAGELDRMGGNFAYGITAVVPVLAEALWDHVASDHKKDDEGENE
jgi:hypothetical protein